MTERPVGLIRIGYPVASLDRGGAELQLLALAERLPRDRFEVTFLCRSNEGALADRARAAGARVVLIGHETRPTRAGRLLAGLDRVGGYVQSVRRLGLDIVDAWLYPTDVLASVLKDVTGRPVVISGRRNTATHPGPRFAVRLAEAVVNCRAAVIVANSTAAADFAVSVQHAVASKVRVIQNGVDIPGRLDPINVARMRQELGAAPGDVLIGCIGNLRAVKRQALVVDAFRIVHEAMPATRLALIGDGPMRREIGEHIERAGLSGHVTMPGSVADVIAVCQALDVVVQASRSEGMPNAILEAAAAGRAIVATDAGGTRDIVVDGATGILVPTDDKDALVRGLLALLDDPGLGVRLGAAARAHVAAVFGMDRFVQERALLYQELVADR